jgi:hypothetical protein
MVVILSRQATDLHHPGLDHSIGNLSILRSAQDVNEMPPTFVVLEPPLLYSPTRVDPLGLLVPDLMPPPARI